MDNKYDISHNLENTVYNELIYMGYNVNVFNDKNKTENLFSATLPHGKAFLLHRTKLVLHRPVSDGRHPIIFR